jgi:hypothetical protein
MKLGRTKKEEKHFGKKEPFFVVMFCSALNKF